MYLAISIGKLLRDINRAALDEVLALSFIASQVNQNNDHTDLLCKAQIAEKSHRQFDVLSYEYFDTVELYQKFDLLTFDQVDQITTLYLRICKLAGKGYFKSHWSYPIQLFGHAGQHYWITEWDDISTEHNNFFYHLVSDILRKV